MTDSETVSIWKPQYGVLPSLPPDWRIYNLRLRLSGKWLCRVQHINREIFLYSGNHINPQCAVEACRMMILEFEEKHKEAA